MIAESMADQAAVVRQQLLDDSSLDAERLNQIIEDPGTPAGVRVAALSARVNLRRSVGRLVGAEVPERHWHLHGSANGNRQALAPIPIGRNIEIIFEPFTGGDPSFIPGHRIEKACDMEAEISEA